LWGLGFERWLLKGWLHPDRASISMLFRLCQGWKDALTKTEKHEGRSGSG